MSLSFSNLPSDIIRHHILPFLEYDSRQTLNQLLPPYERLIKRIPIKERIQHDIAANMSISQNFINRMNMTSNRVNRVGLWRNYCKELLSYKINTLLKYNPSFNDTIRYQLSVWNDQDTLIQYNIPIWLRRRIMYLTAQILDKLDNALPVSLDFHKVKAQAIAII
jgi:hypothetical protein